MLKWIFIVAYKEINLCFALNISYTDLLHLTYFQLFLVIINLIKKYHLYIKSVNFEIEIEKLRT